jgi:hypothetical protein
MLVVDSLHFGLFPLLVDSVWFKMNSTVFSHTPFFLFLFEIAKKPPGLDFQKYMSGIREPLRLCIKYSKRRKNK